MFEELKIEEMILFIKVVFSTLSKHQSTNDVFDSFVVVMVIQSTVKT